MCARQGFSSLPPSFDSILRAQTNHILASKGGCDLWERLPPDLLRAIVEASTRSQLQAYIQLLGLSHAVRVSIRGTLRELSLDPDPVLLGITPTITPDALASLVGPCKSLRKLSFSDGWGGDVSMAAQINDGWVDEAFGGHAQLAILAQLPSLPEPVVERILGHLPGLAELAASPRLALSARLLAALARSCPGLQVLRCSVGDGRADPAQLAALAPLSSVLTELEIQGDPNLESLAALVGTLSAVASLKLPRCPPAALEPIGPHLTSLELGSSLGEEDLPGPWLCRLEVLSLTTKSDRFSAPLTRLLAANQATLRSLTLTLHLGDAAKVPLLMASLRAMPHLTHLDCGASGPGCTLSAILSPDLVDRLESLTILLDAAEPAPVRIASRSLQKLRLGARMGPTSGLTLHCPALVELDLAGKAPRLTLQCPRLRALSAFPDQNLDGVGPVPDLERAAFSWGHSVDPALLTGSLPRLRELSGVLLTRPDTLARLCACRSLVRLQELRLDVTRLPNPLVLRLPEQLEVLYLQVESGADVSSDRGVPLPPLDLHLEAPGLLDLAVDIGGASLLPSVRLRLHVCPHLVRFGLESPIATLSLQVDEDVDLVGALAMQPRSLSVGGALDAASMVGLLTRHGARLREVTSSQKLRATSEDWPQLMGALSGLPRLTSLTMNATGASSSLSLSGPQLQRLFLIGLSDEVKVVMACPLLEHVLGIGDPSRQLELALPAPKLRL
ncbi:hypothetical protein PAPYR_1784 [Paratrimastix pyriformis]|uniref:Uncharacterized protein n=1 Tax=Paratrimastix pyriformis TaxID=342808 RepID=A0ABQ8UR99_9EUKA|nr:hypothetical protein PAPYR_1784 [Paratrimastix pyriformis]